MIDGITSVLAARRGQVHNTAMAHSRDAALRKACADLEAVFINEMLKTMRSSTVPEGGVLSGGTGEEIFSGLLDEHLAGTAAQRLEQGLGAALYRRLRGGGSANGDTSLGDPAMLTPSVSKPASPANVPVVTPGGAL
jgi:flagellar protein FlgJ